MPIPLKEYVQQVLAEHNRGMEIRQALYHGADALKMQSDAGWWRRKSTRRHYLWENAVAKLVEFVADDRGVVTIPHYDTVSFVYDDAVLVRVKKADYTLHSSNYPTDLAQLFHDHDADLFGYTGLQRVEAVYIPNRFDTGIVWAGIVARDKKMPLWHFELVDITTTPVLPLPVQPPATSPADLAKLKTQPNQKKKSGETNDK